LRRRNGWDYFDFHVERRDGGAAGAAACKTQICYRRFRTGLPEALRSPFVLLFYRVARRIAMNELAMNFASQRVDHGDLKVMVVAEAVVAKVLRKHSAVRDRFEVAVELNSNPVAERNAISHVEEKCLHCHHLARFCRSPASSADRRAEATIGKRLAEAPRLVLNDGYRAFQQNGGASAKEPASISTTNRPI